MPKKAKTKSGILGRKVVGFTGPGKTRSNAKRNYGGQTSEQRKDLAQFEMVDVNHPEWGRGVEVSGSQYLTSLVTTAVDGTLMTGNSPTNPNFTYVSPDNMNQRLALIARNFARYCFKELEFWYDPLVASTQAGGMAIGYSEDPTAPSAATPSYTGTQNMTPSIVTPFREAAKLLVKVASDKLLNTELDTGSTAGVRQTAQGVVQAYPNVGSIGIVAQGNLVVRFVCWLFGAMYDYGFTLRLHSKEEMDIVEAALAMYKIAKAREVREKFGATRDDLLELVQGVNSMKRLYSEEWLEAHSLFDLMGDLQLSELANRSAPRLLMNHQTIETVSRPPVTPEKVLQGHNCCGTK